MLFNSMNNNKVAPSDSDGDPVVLSQKLQSLRHWLDENPHINGRNDSESLYFFLRSCKYDVERTKKKIKCFYLMRADRTEWYDRRDPMLPEMQELLDIGVFLPLDGVDELNRKVVIIRTSAHDPKKHTQNNVFKVSKMILDLLISLEPENCVNGIVAIFDMSGVQLGHALQLNPKLIRRSVESWQAYPCQPKLLEFINTPIHVNLVLNTFRMFMTPKMRSRVVIQKRCCSVAKELRPRDIGGLGTSYKELALKWKQLVEANVDFFVEDDKYKSHLDV